MSDVEELVMRDDVYKGELPDKLSELMQAALDDLIKCERSKKYKVDMNYWHTPRYEDMYRTCAVCFAGSVMAKEFDTDPKKAASIYEFNTVNSNKFQALSGIGIGGYIDEAVRRVYRVGPNNRSKVVTDIRNHAMEYSRQRIKYETARKAWKRWLRKAIKLVAAFEDAYPQCEPQWSRYWVPGNGDV